MEQKNKQILELSNNLLSRYKKNAGASASAADASGNLQKGNKRFSGIMKATRKQFSNDAKKSVAEAKDPREYDYEGDMAKSQLRSIIANAQSVHDMLEDTTNIAEWVQSKITLAADYISTVADYMQSEVNEAVTVKKEKYSWGKMMTVHHGSDTSYPLHPEHQQAIAKLKPGEKTSFKDETNSSVHAHRDGDTVHLTRPKLSSTKTSVAHSNFNESVNEAYTEDDIAKGGTVIYKKARSRPGTSGWSHHISKVSHKTGGGAGTIIHTVSGHKVPLNHVVSTDASDWKGLKEETEQGETKGQWSKTGKIGTHFATGQKTFEWAKVNDKGDRTGERHYRNASGKVMGEETVLETKGAPKGFHFTKDGKLKRGDADQDGNGGPMLRTDPLDKQRNKVPAVSEGTNNTFKSFRYQLAEKHLTPAEMKKREEVATAMEREQPGMPMGKKMAIATATAKKAA